MLKTRGIKQAFIFVNSKLGCAVWRAAWSATASRPPRCMATKPGTERLKALEAFKKGEVDLLVCTDVAARGLDIRTCLRCSTLTPFNAEDYVHCIGRTPCGRVGLAVTLVSGSDARLVADIEKLIKKRSSWKPSSTKKTAPRSHQ